MRFVSLPEIDMDDRAFEVRKFASSTRLRELLRAFRNFSILPGCAKRAANILWLTASRGFAGQKNMRRGGQFAVFSLRTAMPANFGRKIEKKIFQREIDLAEKAQIISTLLRLFQPEEIPILFSDLRLRTARKFCANGRRFPATGPETLEPPASGAIAGARGDRGRRLGERSRESHFASPPGC